MKRDHTRQLLNSKQVSLKGMLFIISFIRKSSKGAMGSAKG
jgi:hypothetical protein